MKLPTKTKKLSAKSVEQFRCHIRDYFNIHGRSFSWRQTQNPYHIVVSEIMLQQTQTYRVEKKYDLFIEQFPDIQSLAQASLRNVLAAWQGLGYNRRALALHKTAQIIVNQYNSCVPNNPEILVTFPGIGKATAASICAFAFNKPTVFIETNIRSVYIQFFFPNTAKIHDNDLYPLIEQTLDTAHPRRWYYALMDYGVMLKKTNINPSLRSIHHTTQSIFEGSDRQIRGLILKILTSKSPVTIQELLVDINRDEQRVQRIMSDLMQEGFIECKGQLVKIC
jgi:A/G-specific adenine glycosylase